MKILIWGIPCVGKAEIGNLLADKLNYNFIDLNNIIKEKYKTIDNFNDTYKNDYERFKEKEKIILDIIKNNDNFVMNITLIYIKSIVDEILKTDTISVELIDSVESIYDRIVFYDENDVLMPDSKEYRDKHKSHYIKEIKKDQITSYNEYINIPKFDINNRKFEDIIDELNEFINKLTIEKSK